MTRRVKYPAGQNPMMLAVKNATVYTDTEVDMLCTPIEISVDAMRQGTAKDWHMNQLITCINLMMSIEKQGVVKGLYDSLITIQNTLVGIKRRGVAAGQLLGVCTDDTEQAELVLLLKLFRFQVSELSHGEYVRAVNHANADAARMGIKVIT